MKREYRVCPRGCKCVWAECLDGTCFCMLSVCPYTAISDGARVVSPIESESAAEGRTDGWGAGDAMSRPVGRPPKYKSVEEIEQKIEAYFKSCEGEPLKDRDGTVLTDKYGAPIIVGKRPPTVTGLALALGFASRQALLNYQGRKQFNDTITRAKTYVEQYAEEGLFDREGVQGAKFSLVNNFKGWSEKPESESDAELLQKAAELLGGVDSVI